MTEAILHLSAGILNACILRYTEVARLRAETQAGFRPGLSTLHPILGLEHFVHAAKPSGQPLFACALDLKGAYIGFSAQFLRQVIQRLGIHGDTLAAIQSLYIDSQLAINSNGRFGMPALFKTSVKQGCLLSPTLFGLFANGLHRFLLHCCPNEGPCLQNGRAIPDLGYAYDFVLLAATAMGLQRPLDVVAKFCTSIGMVIHIQRLK